MDCVVVTGATRGVGLGIAIRLAADGYRVIGVGRRLSEEFEAASSASPGRMAFAPFDLSRTEGIHAFASELVQREGVPFGLVNNAAVGLDGVLGTQHESDIAELLRVNLHAPILLTKYLSRQMMTRRRGRIVNISSIVATTGFSGLSVYGATKAGLVGFTRSLARELGRLDITVNAVAAGFMVTAMTAGLGEGELERIRRRSALRRHATVDDVASAVSYLLSPGAAAVTGTILTVDAGSTA